MTVVRCPRRSSLELEAHLGAGRVDAVETELSGKRGSGLVVRRGSGFLRYRLLGRRLLGRRLASSRSAVAGGELRRLQL
jgi:hypothetical protein